MRLRIGAVLLVMSSSSTWAQQAVQLPVVGNTSVSTSVSVPDRGRIYLGGASSAQSGRSQYGPFRSGPSSGLTRTATSMSATVSIHDLHAMDEELLNSAPSSTPSAASDVRGTAGSIAARLAARETAKQVEVEPVDKAAQFEQLAKKAEEAGKASVAKMHWQMAARHGSRSAQTRLAELAKPTPAATSRTVAGRR